MASSGAARPAVQRALQTCSNLTRPSLLVHHTQVRHATRATKAKAKAKAEALANPGGGAANALKKKSQVVARPHPNRDHNKQRGLSVMRQTGPREHLSVSGVPLPRPLSAEEFPRLKVDASHGLWDFFHTKGVPLNKPNVDAAHGRGWTVEELRYKKWEDLHSLWWVCIKERNRIATGNAERLKGQYGYGAVESRARELEVGSHCCYDLALLGICLFLTRRMLTVLQLLQVRKTQNAIKHALTERFYAWEDAVQLAKEDPEIEFTEDGGVMYTPAGEGGQEESSWVEEDETLAGGEHLVAVEAAQADKEVKHETIDPSIPQDGGSPQHNGPRP